MATKMDGQELSSINETNDTSLSEPIFFKEIMTVFYVIIFVTGILGNINTCIAIGRDDSLQTPINFYLFNLAIANLLLLICGLPLEVYGLMIRSTYLFREVLCLTVSLLSNATALTITAFSIEAYIAICRPFLSRRSSKLSIVRYIIAIWLFALCSAVPQVMHFDKVTYEEKGMLSACSVKGQGERLDLVISSFIFFVLPMFLTIIMYVSIGVKLFTFRDLYPVINYSAESSERSEVTPRNRNRTSQGKVIRMLVAVALSFFLCWAPLKTQRMIEIYGKNLDQPTDIVYKIYVVLTYLSGVLCYLFTSINPILCNIMSNEFRNAFKVTFTSWCIRRDRSRLDWTHSALLASQGQRAAVRALQRSPQPRVLRRLSTVSFQQCEAPIQAQVRSGQPLSLIESEEWLELKRVAQGHDSLTSPQSISNSSLREVDQELNSEELATYLHQVNCKIIGNTCDTSV